MSLSMKPLSIFHISRYDHDGVKTLQVFTGRDNKETYDRADSRLEYWWNKYPNANIDIERKA